MYHRFNENKYPSTNIQIEIFKKRIEIIKKNIKSLNDWKEISELIPKKFKETKMLKKSGMAGLFSASLELTKEGLINIMQKKGFDRLLIKERK